MSAAAFGARLTVCKCGHAAIEHYDSYNFCTWTLEDKCECEKFEAGGVEIWVSVPGGVEYRPVEGSDADGAPA